MFREVSVRGGGRTKEGIEVLKPQVGSEEKTSPFDVLNICLFIYCLVPQETSEGRFHAVSSFGNKNRH